MKKKISKVIKKVVPGVVVGVMYCSKFVSAATLTATPNDILKPFNLLITLLCAVVALVGVIVIVKNVMEFAMAWQQNDTSTMLSAAKGFGAGVVMAAITSVLAYLGYTS